ncbi:hypothetical protein H6F39_04565 [Anabaena sp. FACHB-1250]|uniref:hypothetical protein n=1 Tax=unclassified Anabaena TaxID=2619674 RepID=UPI0016810F62|nr:MULTISPECIES: hypothetical protein [unclassified Anabaena]MBD2140669.1 hypothetical protein [Anabaena sp. FACHB-1250]MBD2268773.1 hypothetical protein [Anabaena sp. FACHB-1391]
MCDIKLVVEDFIIDSCMGKFTLSRLLPLVVGSAAAGVLALMSPAKAVVLTVNGTPYDVTTIQGTYLDNQDRIKSTPWWDDQNAAYQVVTDYLYLFLPQPEFPTQQLPVSTKFAYSAFYDDYNYSN